MKLHLGTELNTSRSLSCEDTAPTFVGDMAQDLERSYGYDSMFYKGCLQFVHKNLGPCCRQFYIFLIVKP